MRGKAILMLSLLLQNPGAHAQDAPGALPAPPLWLASFPPFAVVPVFPPQVVWPIPPMYFMSGVPAGGWPLPFPFPAFLLQQAPGAGGMAEPAPGVVARPSPEPAGEKLMPVALEPTPAQSAAPSVTTLMALPIQSPAVALGADRQVPAEARHTAAPLATAANTDGVPVAVPLPRLDPPPGAGAGAVPQAKAAPKLASGVARKPAAAPKKPADASKPAKRRLCWKNGTVDACP